MTSRLLVPFLGTVVLCSACGGDASSAATPEQNAQAAVESAAAQNVPSEVAAAAQQAPSGAALNGEPVEVCSMLSKADVESLIGATMGDPTADKPTQSLLGGCMWLGKGGALSISARPAREYKDTVEAYRRKDPTPVDGLSGEAVVSSLGLFWQPAGKPYFLHILSGQDQVIPVNAAKKMAL